MITPESPSFGPRDVAAVAPALSEAVQTYTQALQAEGFKETDMQFNISRLEGEPRRGYDIINPLTKERLFVTGQSDIDSERVLKGVLGEHATLHLREQYEAVQVYEVPRGSRLLVKTLRAAPYKPEYMNKLTARGREFIAQALALDSNAFGLTVNSLALTHNGGEEDDDMFVALVPPLAPMVSEQLAGRSVEAYIRSRKRDVRTLAGRLAVGMSMKDIREVLDELPARQQPSRAPKSEEK